MSGPAAFAAPFSAALLALEFGCPPGLKTWNGSDPAGRFAVHRNNVMASLIDALADGFPVTRALVGEPFFRAMSAAFVRRSPPRSPVLVWYGAEFPDFIADFPPADSLPYLADMARLEWLRVEAWHAADASPMAADALRGLAANGAALAATRLVLHPAVRVLTSSHPVVSLWAAHQDVDPDAALAAIDLGRPESALLARPAHAVDIMPLAADAARFVARLQGGALLGEAASSPSLDLPATLALLIRLGAITGASALEMTT